MGDDQLRMQATIGDGFSGPLAKMRDELRATGKMSTLGDMRKDWIGIDKSVNGVLGSMKFGLAPVMRAIGLGSLGVGAAIGGMVAGLRSFGNETRNLSIFSRQIGISVQKLRELEALGKRFDMSPGQMQGSLKTFSDQMFELQNSWGSGFDKLSGTEGAQFMIKDLKDALKHGGLGEAFDKLLEDLKQIPNLNVRRKIAEVFGGEKLAELATESSRKMRSAWAADVAKLGPDSERAAEAFVNNMKDIGQSLTNLRNEGLGPLLPEFNRFIELLSKPGADGSGAVFVELMRQLGGALKDINDAIAWLQKNGPARGEVGGLPNKGTLGEALGKGMVGGAVAGGVIGSVVPGAGTATGSAVGAFVGGAWEGGKHLWPTIAEELQKLRKALEDANKNGALLQQQSYTGRGFGGARIMNASLGGGLGPDLGLRSVSPNLNMPPNSGPRGGPLVPAIGDGGGLRLKADRQRNAQEIYAQLRALGHTHEQASAALGHAFAESGFNPRVRGDQGTAFGFFQHRGERWRNHLAMAKRLGLDPYSPEAAARHFDEELRTSESRAGKKYFSSRTTQDAVTALNGYERFAGWQHGQSGRYSAAERFSRSLHLKDKKNAGDSMLGRAFPPLPRPAPAEIRGNAVIDINFNNLPGGSKIRSGFGGMFREVNIYRGRQMAATSDETGNI